MGMGERVPLLRRGNGIMNYEFSFFNYQLSIINYQLMKMSKETWKTVLKVVGAAIAAIISALGVQAMTRP